MEQRPAFYFHVQFQCRFRLGSYAIHWNTWYQRNFHENRTCFEVDMFPENKQFPDFRLDLGNLVVTACNEWIDADDIPF